MKVQEIIFSIKPIIDEIIKNNGKPYLVGGTVRDILLNLPIKDLDIEVHGLTLENLEKILAKFGTVKLVGQKFGVLRLLDKDVDWSLPRIDSIGRKPEVFIDSDLTIEKALKRRDLTINAMAIDLSQPELKIIDPFNGQKDLKNKILRAVDKDFFIQDPLRFYRVMQFIGRFDFFPDDSLNNICKNISLYDQSLEKFVSVERVEQEIKKLFLKSIRPSLGFRWLKSINRLKDTFPEIYQLIGIKQKPSYHPEGDVFEHAMQSLDAAAQLNYYQNDEEKFLIMLAALSHDMGKIVCTDLDLSCKGHDKQGAKIAKKFLSRFIQNKTLIKSVCKLVLYHMRPFVLFKQKSGLSAYKRLAIKLAPELNLRQIGLVNLADMRGRNPDLEWPLKDYCQDLFDGYLERIKQAQVEQGPVKPILQGRDLIDLIPAGVLMGKILKQAYLIQIEENIEDKETLKKKVLEIFLDNQS